MRKGYVVLYTIVAVALEVFTPCGASAQTEWGQTSPQISGLSLYDTFDQQFINPLKWFSQWQCGSPSVMECDRDIYNGRLRFRVRSYGTNSDNEGRQDGISQLYLTAAAATDISADVIVQSTTARACAANANDAFGQALLFGNFFNGGGGTFTDDVTAFLQLGRSYSSPVGEVYVGGFLEYQNQFFDNVDLGVIRVGELVRIELKWDQPNHRFIIRLFRPSRGTASEQYMPYTVSDVTPAVFPYKALSGRSFSPNCTTGVTFADMSVLFDNVRTNVASAR